MNKKKVVNLLDVKQKKIDAELAEKLELMKHDDESVFELASTITRDMVELIEDFGYFVEDNPDSMKDIVFIIEAIKGLIFRTRNETYSIHEISDALVQIDDVDELLESFMENY
jgi:hypothetical protein